MFPSSSFILFFFSPLIFSTQYIQNFYFDIKSSVKSNFIFSRLFPKSVP